MQREKGHHMMTPLLQVEYMVRRTSVRFGLIVGIFACCALPFGTAQAAITNGESLVVGNLLFSNFSVSGSLPLSDLDVTAAPFGQEGIQFSIPLLALGGSSSNVVSQDELINYTVTTLNGQALITDAELNQVGGIIGNGLGWISELVSGSGGSLGQLQTYDEVTTSNSLSSVTFTPQSELFLSKDILVAASCDGSATITGTDQLFSEVPEPSAMALCFAGLAGVWFLRRRQS
jgi:hypothetical protein